MRTSQQLLPSSLSGCCANCKSVSGEAGLSGLSISTSTVLWVLVGAGAGIATAHFSGMKQSTIMFAVIGGFLGALID